MGFYGAYLVAALVLVAASFSIPGQSRWLPLAALVVLVTLLSLRLAGCLWTSLGQWLEQLGKGTGPAGGETASELDVLAARAQLRSTLAAMGWWAAAAGMAYLAGFVVDMPVFFTLFPWLFGRRPLSRAALFAAAVSGSLYVLFERGMHLTLYRGVLAWPAG